MSIKTTIFQESKKVIKNFERNVHKNDKKILLENFRKKLLIESNFEKGKKFQKNKKKILIFFSELCFAPGSPSKFKRFDLTKCYLEQPKSCL
jgi:hypothetical protein